MFNKDKIDMIKSNKKSKSFVNFLTIFFILIFFIFLKEIIPIESNFGRMLCAYTIILSFIFVSIKYFYKNNFEKFGLNLKTKLSKNVKRNAIFIGLAIGVAFNLVMYYTIDFTDYLKGFGFFERFLLATILGPIVEEIVFRGYIQTIIGIELIKKHATGFWFPIIITALLFGLGHFTALRRVDISQTLGIVSMAFVIGIASGYFKEKHKSIVPSVYLHIATNFGSGIIVAILLFSTPNEKRKEIFRNIDKPEYNFDMNDSATFYNSLINYQIYEKIVPENAKGKRFNTDIPILITVDTSGKVILAVVDTTYKRYKPLGIGLEDAALEMARKMPKWKVPKEMTNDTTILFLVRY